jgi:hypothetical protein
MEVDSASQATTSELLDAGLELVVANRAFSLNGRDAHERLALGLKLIAKVLRLLA